MPLLAESVMRALIVTRSLSDFPPGTGDVRGRPHDRPLAKINQALVRRNPSFAGGELFRKSTNDPVILAFLYYIPRLLDGGRIAEEPPRYRLLGLLEFIIGEGHRHVLGRIRNYVAGRCQKRGNSHPRVRDARTCWKAIDKPRQRRRVAGPLQKRPRNLVGINASG